MKRGGDPSARIAASVALVAALCGLWALLAPRADAQAFTPPAFTPPTMPPFEPPSFEPPPPGYDSAPTPESHGMPTAPPSEPTWTPESFSAYMGTPTPGELAAFDAFLAAAEDGDQADDEEPTATTVTDRDERTRDDSETVDVEDTQPVAASQASSSAKQESLEAAVKQDARHFGYPLVLAVFVALFLFFQGQVDRHEPKLADAPLDQGERLRFKS